MNIVLCGRQNWSCTLREEQRLRVTEHGVPRKRVERRGGREGRLEKNPLMTIFMNSTCYHIESVSFTVSLCTAANTEYLGSCGHSV